MVLSRQHADAVGQLSGIALRAAPVGEAQVRPLRELGEMQLHPPRERFLQRMERARGRPCDRLGERLRLEVRLVGARERPVRLAHHDPRALGQELGGRGQRVVQERRQGLRALHEEPVREPLELIGEPVRVLRCLLLRACPQRGVGDHLADGRHLDLRDLVRGELGRGDELAHGFDLVAPVLETDRTTGGAGEHVDDTAAHGELAAPLHHVHARVAQIHQTLGQRVRRELAARHQHLGGTVPSDGISPCIAARAGATKTNGPRASRRRRTAPARRAATSGDGEMPS